MQETLTPGAPPASPPLTEKPRQFLPFVDGLRGLAALEVVYFHLRNSGGAQWSPDSSSLSPVLAWIASAFTYGWVGVSVFFVLSGFLLTLQPAAAPDLRLRGGFRTYFKRRAWRILPTYYIALLVPLLMVFVSLCTSAIYGLGKAPEPALQRIYVSWENVLAHILLVHNVRRDWIQTIDAPMWSLALEWQLYLLLPLVLLPCWRKFGLLATVVLTASIGVIPAYLLPEKVNPWWAFPYQMGNFAFGMSAAAILVRDEPFCRRLRSRMPWGVVAALFLVLAVTLLKIPALHSLVHSYGSWPVGYLAGLATAALLVHCSLVGEGRSRWTGVSRFLSSRPLVGLGIMSYSLYLFHGFFVGGLASLVRQTGFSPNVQFLLVHTVGAALVTVLCFICFLFFEQPFLRKFRVTPRGSEARSTQLSLVAGLGAAAILCGILFWCWSVGVRQQKTPHPEAVALADLCRQLARETSKPRLLVLHTDSADRSLGAQVSKLLWESRSSSKPIGVAGPTFPAREFYKQINHAFFAADVLLCSNPERQQQASLNSSHSDWQRVNALLWKREVAERLGWRELRRRKDTVLYRRATRSEAGTASRTPVEALRAELLINAGLSSPDGKQLIRAVAPLALIREATPHGRDLPVRISETGEAEVLMHSAHKGNRLHDSLSVVAKDNCRISAEMISSLGDGITIIVHHEGAGSASPGRLDVAPVSQKRVSVTLSDLFKGSPLVSAETSCTLVVNPGPAGQAASDGVWVSFAPARM